MSIQLKEQAERVEELKLRYGNTTVFEVNQQRDQLHQDRINLIEDHITLINDITDYPPAIQLELGEKAGWI